MRWLANKLSAGGRHSVLVLEAGPMDRNLMIHIPAGLYLAYKNPRINWNYLTEAEAELHGRRVEMPRGKVVGGSSSINGMVYMRGLPQDYDRWAGEPGLEEWRYSRCLPYFKAGETSGSRSQRLARRRRTARRDEGGVGQSALRRLSRSRRPGRPRGRPTTPTATTRKASPALTPPGATAGGAAPPPPYLHPALSRPNLTLKTRAMVERLVISGNRASGVMYTRGGETLTVEAEKEVILSGGAINSPKTLMLSGIGPADHLREHGIEVRCDLPGVGRNLQDHATVAMMWSCTRSFPVHRVNRPLQQASLREPSGS